MSAKKTRKTKKTKKKLSAAEKTQLKIKSEHRKSVRNIFRLAGFRRVSGVADKEFTFDGQRSDIDDLFIFENVVVAAEYTTAQTSDVGGHLKNKKLLFDKILNAPSSFLTFLKTNFPSSAGELSTPYHTSKIVLKVLYCSRYSFSEHYKQNVPGPIYFDYPIVRYFASVADAIKKSCRFELFHFFGVPTNSVGNDGKIDVALPSHEYKGSVLPESHSHFDNGFKVITFYADPESLLRTCYVLRKDGWRNSVNVYQRMISKQKIESIRTYLKKQKRVFINNIVVTLPSDVKPLDENSNTIQVSTLISTAPVIIKLPDRPNCIGIIDGQHRVFAYHETVDDDHEIASLRVQQNLLVTGIIFPNNVTELQREQFEARLFLEINSNQTNAKSDLKQAIGLVLDPFSADSIAARVLANLAKSGPLAGFVQQYFFEKDKLKTSSIVSYGLKPLVKTSGNDSLFSIWENPEKDKLTDGKSDTALQNYVEHCTSTINLVLETFRENLADDRWTTDKKVAGRVLTTTYINGFLIVARLLLEKTVPLEAAALKKRLKEIDKFDFTTYHSSQYNRMAAKIVDDYFTR